MSEQQLSAPIRSAALDFLRDPSFGMSAPFSQAVLLAEHARIAGMSHHGEAVDLDAQLEVGTRLELRRDPTSTLDPWTIRILAPGGRQVGFMPADINEVLARLMDAGKRLYAVVDETDETDTWLKIYVKVFLDD